MKRNIYLFLFLLIGCYSLNGQRLTYTQINKNISDLKVPENKSIIVFESDLDLTFTSSMEKLDPPVKKENFYYLIVAERVCIIKVINNVSKSEVELPFGQISEKTLPVIKKGEYLVFNIEEHQKELIVLNQTEAKKGEGLNDNQMLFDKEALLILNVDPFDLEIDLESKQPITAIKHIGKQYKVYIKPVKQDIIVKQKGTDVQGIINILQIEPKEVQYYYVSLPEHLRKREVLFDKSISVGDYLIESVPSGAVIEIFGNPSFNAEKNKTPFLLKGFQSGFKVVTLTLSEYETYIDTIQIGSSKKNKSNYNLVPQFAFININVEPQFPYPSLYVDNQLYSAQNETNIKIPVSSKEVEIRAQYFESEIFKINPTPGEVISITIKMKPILGKLYLECGENAEKGKIYVSYSKLNIEKKLIGTLPIKDTIILQEGQYDLIVEKEGYASFKKQIQIEKNQIRKETIALGLRKKVIIITNPDDAAIYIDGYYVGRSNKKLMLSVGSHEITVIKEGYENKYENISALSETDSLFIHLNKNYLLYTVNGFGFKFFDEQIWKEQTILPYLYVDSQYIGALWGDASDRKLPQLFSINPDKRHIINIKFNDYMENIASFLFPYKESERFVYNDPFWFRIKRIYEGVNGVIFTRNKIDTLKNLDNTFKIVINNHLDNPLSIICDRKILFFKKSEEKYILYLKPKIQKIQISEDKTPFSRIFTFNPTSDLKNNEYIELNIYRDSTIANKTIFVDDNQKNYNEKDAFGNIIVINNSKKKLHFSIEGINNVYSHCLTVLPYNHLELIIPMGLFRIVSIGGGCAATTLQLSVDSDKILKITNKHYKNRFTLIANAAFWCDPEKKVFSENISKKSN